MNLELEIGQNEEQSQKYEKMITNKFKDLISQEMLLTK